MNRSEYTSLFCACAWRLLPVALACSIASPVLASAFTQEVFGGIVIQQSPKLLPLDPLTQEERELAKRVASEAEETKKALGQTDKKLSSARHRLISVGLATPKPAEGGGARSGRYAELIFYRYDTRRGIRVLVDLERQVVSEIASFDGRAAPLAEEEVTEAFKLALKNNLVLDMLGSDAHQFKAVERESQDDQSPRVEGLKIVSPSPMDPCHRNRCVMLLFRRGQSYLRDASVIVDLTTRTLRAERRRK